MTRWSRSLFSAALILAIASVVLGCRAGTEETFQGGAPGETTGPVGLVDEAGQGSAILEAGCMTSTHRLPPISKGLDDSWERVVGTRLRHRPRE